MDWGASFIRIASTRCPKGHAFIVLVPEKSEYGLPENPAGPWELAGSICMANWASVCAGNARSLWASDSHGADRRGGNAFFSLIRQAEHRVSVDPFTASTQCFAFLAAWTREASTPVARTSTRAGGQADLRAAIPRAHRHQGARGGNRAFPRAFHPAVFRADENGSGGFFYEGCARGRRANSSTAPA